MISKLHRIFRVIVVAATMAVALGAAPAAASHDHDKALHAVKNGEIRPLSEILNEVKDQLPGQVIKTKLERKDKVWVYEFRVVDHDGQLFEVHVDARSGKIRRMEKK